MRERTRMTIMTMIMIVACLVTAAVTITVLYSAELSKTRSRLRVAVQSQARLIEAVARHDSGTTELLLDVNPDFDAAEAALSQIIEAHENYDGSGETREFLLARREDNTIVFLLRHGRQDVGRLEPVAFDSDLAEPMRRALSGQSGTLIGPDYDGETVIAAYEPVQVLDFGLVAKIGLREIRQGFVLATIYALVATIVLAFFASLIFRKVGDPVISRLMSYSKKLEQEIEERKQIERSLTETERLHDEAQRIAGLGHWSLDVVTNELRWSDEIYRMFEVDRSKYGVLNKAFLNVIHPDDREYVKNAYINSVANRIPYDIIHRLLLKDGSIRYVNERCETFYDQDEKPIRSIGTTCDVTAAKEAEIELLNSERLLRRAEALAHVGHWSLNVTDNSLELSDEMIRIVGFDPAACELTLEEYNDCYHPDDSETLLKLVSDSIRRGRGFESELRIVRPDGEIRHVYSKAEIEIGGNGEAQFLYGVTHDITDRKKNESERLSLERQMLHAQKLESLGILAGGIAHDFNNLLMTVLGNADLALQDLAPQASARGSIESIETAARRAAALSGQMLAYSGKGQFVIETFNLNEFVAEMSHLLEVSISKSAALRYNFADELPLMEGDATQIRQVIMNLIINASEALEGKSGIISITTGSMECDRNYLNQTNFVSRSATDVSLFEGLYVFIEVADTGCGMDRETTERIFDPFFTTKPTGHGLGMAAVLGIVRGHGGSINVYSEPDKGTTFKILFPACASALSESNGQTRGKNDLDEWHGEGTILFADDEEQIRAVNKRILERFGFEVITASDGLEAVKRFRENRDDIVCVLLDMTMPHMDGKETFREIRRIQEDAKVILCSGYNEQEATQHFVGKGLAGFIQKPYRSVELRDRLRDVLST